MKFVFTIVLLVMKSSFAQGQDYGTIDWKVQFIDAPTPDSLAKLLTVPYPAELQKVRAIFSWIAQHISYNTFVISNNRRYASSKYVVEPDDTCSIWKPAIEMTAIKVLKKRTAVCDGYAKLFKTLCDYAGLRSELITGYARGYATGANKFLSNHTWNAVMIDSTWKLLDVTWASGYIDFSNRFVQRLDDTYFLTPPQQFINDHYPEDLRWTLMDNPPALSEFKRMPFRYKSFVKYSIIAYSPANGIIEAVVGDTVQIEVHARDIKRDKRISSDPFFDSTMIERSPASEFLPASDTVGNKIIYTYIVHSPAIEWLNIMYNNDIVMRYRLHVAIAGHKEIAMKRAGE